MDPIMGDVHLLRSSHRIWIISMPLGDRLDLIVFFSNESCVESSLDYFQKEVIIYMYIDIIHIYIYIVCVFAYIYMFTLHVYILFVFCMLDVFILISWFIYTHWHMVWPYIYFIYCNPFQGGFPFFQRSLNDMWAKSETMMWPVVSCFLGFGPSEGNLRSGWFGI